MIGETLATRSISERWSPKRLADEINAAVRSANPVHDLADRRMPDGAYKPHIRPGLIVTREA